MRSLRSRSKSLLLAIAGPAALVGCATISGPAFASDVAETKATERIVGFDAAYEIDQAGWIAVTERITYDFGERRKHGITRTVRTRVRLPDDRHDRVYQLEDVRVQSPSRAPTELEVRREPFTTVLVIGDRGQTITGRHTYEVRYHLRGALTPLDGQVKLSWEAYGSGTAVPADVVTVVVAAPARVEQVACRSDTSRGLKEIPCDQAQIGGGARSARFTQTRLEPNDTITIAVSLAENGVRPPPPTIVAANNLTGGPFGDVLARPGPVPWGVTAALLLGSLALLTIVRRRRRYPAVPTPRPQPQPPDDLNPALAAILLTGRVTNRDLSALLLHLAVRGHLRVRFRNEAGWRLTRLRTDGDRTTAAERRLLTALFPGGGNDLVLVASSQRRRADGLETIKHALYAETIRRGWYRKRPDLARHPWLLAGWVLGLVSLVTGVLAALNSQLGLIVMSGGTLFAAIALLITSRMMPGRTAAGVAARQDVLGFRSYLSTFQPDQWDLPATEAGQAVNRYLPWVLVFGLSDQWAKIWSASNLVTATSTDPGAPDYSTTGWYDGQLGYSAPPIAVFAGLGAAVATTSALGPGHGSASSDGGGGADVSGGSGGTGSW